MATITGNWILPNGSAVANGLLYLQLSRAAQTGGANQVTVPYTVVTLNSSGSIPASTTVVGNDALTPSGSYYLCYVSQFGGGLIWGPQSVTVSGSTFNFNTFTPA